MMSNKMRKCADLFIQLISLQPITEVKINTIMSVNNTNRNNKLLHPQDMTKDTLKEIRRHQHTWKGKGFSSAWKKHSNYSYLFPGDKTNR